MRRTICVILGVASLGLGALLIRSTLLLVILPPTFESSAKLLTRVSMPNPSNSPIEPDVELFESKEVLSQVITNLNLSKRWGDKFATGMLPFDATYAMLRNQVDIRRPTNGTVVEIRATSEDPNEAAAIANAVAQIAITQLAGPEGPSPNAKTVAYSLVAKATASRHPVRPGRFQKTAFAIGGFAAIIVGVVLLILASMMPSRSNRPPLQA